MPFLLLERNKSQGDEIVGLYIDLENRYNFVWLFRYTTLLCSKSNNSNVLLRIVLICRLWFNCHQLFVSIWSSRPGTSKPWPMV